MFVDWWVVLIWAMLQELMCSNIHVYVHASFICIFCAIMLKSIPQEVANVSILTCMHDCNFADEVCVSVMSTRTLLWTCPQNRGHMDGLNVGSISFYFILQIIYLGVYKCILCPCDHFAHSMHVFQAATCMQCKPLFCGLCKCCSFFEQVCFTKMAINRVFLQL